MQNLRTYGNPPFTLALLHGGPGAPGEMAPVARELAAEHGVLEPLQIADRVEGQLEELKRVVENNSELPIILVGWSWGAWLGLIFAARNPSFVKKLILICSPPIDEKYSCNIMPTRIGRLSTEDQSEVLSILESFGDTDEVNNRELARFAKLLMKADILDPLPSDDEVIEYQFDIFRKVWGEASALRHGGKLIEYAKELQCPVVAIHGDYDPHTYEGVEIPLSEIIRDFKFILLNSCGHYPWLERGARASFYEILRDELGH